MSGLCKVEMSAFLGAGGPDGRGADRVERERAGAFEGVARDHTGTFAADRCRTPIAAERSAGAATAAASSPGRGSRAGAWVARTFLQSQDSRGHRAAQSATAAAAGLSGVRSDAGRRTSGAARAAGEPGDAAQVDECRRTATATPPTPAAGACVAAAPCGLRRTGDDGQLAVPLAGTARPGLPVDCHD